MYIFGIRKSIKEFIYVHTENWSTFLRMLKKNWLSLHVRLLTVTYASPDAVLS